jgi:hypothetical protein
MISKLSIAGIAIILWAAAFPLSVAQGVEALIEGLQMERENGTVMVSFSVKNCFNTKMEEAIKAGVPTTFNFFVTLYKSRALIWDKKIASRKFPGLFSNHRFLIWLRGKGKYACRLGGQTLNAAGGRISREDRTRGLWAGSKAELDAVKLPLGLEGILFFVSLWDFETDWQYHTIRVEP